MNVLKLVSVVSAATAVFAVMLGTSGLPLKTSVFYLIASVAVTLAAFLLDPKTPLRKKR